LTYNTAELISLHSVHLSNLGLLAVITWLQLYSKFTDVKSKHKSHCLILFASFGSYTTSQQHCAKLRVIKNFLRDTAVTTPVDVFSQVATNTYYVWQSSFKEDHNTFRTTPREHSWI